MKRPDGSDSHARLVALAKYTFEARPWTVNEERRWHHMTRAKRVKEWRESYGWLGLKTKTRFASAHIVVLIVMRPPVADTGAANGSIKAAIDGLVDAGVLPGDGPTHVLSLTMLAPIKATKGETEHVTLILIRGGSNLAEDFVPLLDTPNPTR